jgi:hypothetical protein
MCLGARVVRNTEGEARSERSRKNRCQEGYIRDLKRNSKVEGQLGSQSSRVVILRSEERGTQLSRVSVREDGLTQWVRCLHNTVGSPRSPSHWRSQIHQM